MARTAGIIMVVLGVSLIFSGLALPLVQGQSSGSYQVGVIEILSCPDTVTSGGTFQVSARAHLTDTNYPGNFTVHPYIYGSTCWTGSANVTVNSASWVNFSITVTSGWSTTGSKSLNLGGMLSSNPYVPYTLNSSDIYVNVIGPQTYYNLSVTTEGSGSASPSSGSYLSGTKVSVTATPASGYEFVQWSGDAAGNSNPVEVTMTSNKNLVAHFAPGGGTTTTTTTTTPDQLVTLSYSVSPTSSGSLTTSPSGTSFTKGSSVILTATPKSGYVFDYWTGGISGSENPKTVIMNADTTVVAVFKQTDSNKATLRISTNPTEGGTVIASATSVTKGQVITVSAFPNKGWVFDGWSGAGVTSSEKVIDLYMYGDMDVTANFSEDRGFIGTLSDNMNYLLMAAGAVATVIGIAQIWRKK